MYYQNDYNTLYNGDCNNIMEFLIKQGIKIDNVLTSPPYNIIRPNSIDRGYDFYKDGMSNEEYIQWTLKIFNNYDKLLNKNGCIIYNMSYGAENTECMSLTVAEIIKNTNFTLADIIVWKKQTATPNNVSKNRLTRIVEFIYIFCRKNELMTFETNKKVINERKTGQVIFENRTNIINAKNNDYSQDLNKATFSTEFVNQLLDLYVKKDNVVLDNFSGTGTTLNSCLKKKIKSIGIELSKEQCEHTKKRLENENCKLTLF